MNKAELVEVVSKSAGISKVASEKAVDFVRDRARLERHVHEVLLGLLYSFRDGHRHFRGLALADADPPLTVTDYDEGAKIKALAALDDFGDAIDEYDFIFEAQFVWIDSHSLLPS